uniref:Uncharacterized protein n=1 Tax=Leptobrachium leishanense TaxID=445787 RepID=A0A8C5QUN3_9ANUR
MSSLDCHPSRDLKKDEEGGPALPILQPPRRKLVLHLDLNNTILVSDAVTGQGPTAALNSYLSTVTWGKRTATGGWQWISDCPSVAPPSEDAINYYIRFGRSTDFVDTELGRRFKDVHTRHMKLLEWEGEQDKVFTQIGEDGKGYNWILPSFFHLIEKLHQEGRQFSVILRTFGTDLPLVLRAVRSAFEGKHPLFPQLQYLPVNEIRCSSRETVLTHGADRVTTHQNERAVYDFFNAMNGIGGFQDDFFWWSRNDFTAAGGKPLWINPSDCDIQHIIIDDNIRLNEDDTIVNCRLFIKRGRQDRLVPTSEVYDVCLVPTDLLRAIAEKDYFLDCVRICEENYDRIFTSPKSSPEFHLK